MRNPINGIYYRVHITALIFATLFLLLISPLARADQFAQLKGYWQCQEEGEPVTLEFMSRQQLLYNGQAVNYRHVPGAIQVQEEYGLVNYLYEEAYESGYSGVFNDQGGNQTGNWGATGAQQARGRWKVVGNLRQGKLYLEDQSGRLHVFPYQVHIKGGEVYWSEYFFNGRFYSVKYIYR